MIIDANGKGNKGDETTITTETLFTLYVFNRSGQSKNHRIGVEISPDGNRWMPLPISVLGVGCKVFEAACVKIRPIIMEAEQATSSVDVFLVAK